MVRCSFRTQAPGEGHWEADREGAQGEMSTKPRGQCVPADHAGGSPGPPVPAWPPHAPSGTRVSACLGPHPTAVNKALQSVSFSCCVSSLPPSSARSRPPPSPQASATWARLPGDRRGPHGGAGQGKPGPQREDARLAARDANKLINIRCSSCWCEPLSHRPAHRTSAPSWPTCGRGLFA